MEDAWMDSLSEDWPSQPSSEHSASIPQDVDKFQDNGPRSRIPMPKDRTLSLSSQRSAQRLSSLQPRTNVKNVLGNRAPSDLNLPEKSSLDGLTSSRSQKMSRQKEFKENTDPASPTTEGTIAFKKSPTKEEKWQDTPDWKRRIVHGKIGAADQTDLFGPLGLESVFQPPTADIQFGSKPMIKRKVPDPSTPDSKAPVINPLEASGLGPEDGMQIAQVETLKNRPTEHQRLGHITSSSPLSRTSDNDPMTEQERSSDAVRCPPVAPSTYHSRTHHSPKIDSQNEGSISSAKSKEFSPFYVSKQQTIDGRIDYAAIDRSMRNLHANMERLRLRQHDVHRFSFSRDRRDPTSADVSYDQSDIDRLNEITTHSLPEDLSVGTEAFAANGGFVSVHRGGYSDDGSFQKKTLSPSSSSRLDGSSGLRACTNRSKDAPHTPVETPSDASIKINTDMERPTSSGSPLKLFGMYDTFTNARLAQRMDTFERTIAKYDTRDPEGSRSRSRSLKFIYGSRQVAKSSGEVLDNVSQRRMSCFGSGELDVHNFTEMTGDVSQISDWASESNDLRMSSLQRGVPCKKMPRSYQHHSNQSSSTSRKTSKIKHDGYIENDSGAQSLTKAEPLAHRKRISYSLTEYPDSKRRKRSYSLERERVNTSFMDQKSSSRLQRPTTGSVNGRKRKDARYEGEKPPADPQILAKRRILCPRVPTNGLPDALPRKSTMKEIDKQLHSSSADDDVNPYHQVKIHDIAGVDPPTQIVAGALATVALNTAHDMTGGARKRSMATSDFFNEAQQIMALIRADKRPLSSHNTAETSHVGITTIGEEPSLVDSTKENLSRPPSRERGSVPEVRAPTQHDARIVSHLRKYEDKDELGLALPSTPGSLMNRQDRPIDEAQVDAEPEESHSDPPNMRIRESLIDQGEPKRVQRSCSENSFKSESENHHSNSQKDSSRSTGKTLKTASSRSSVNLKMIAPHSVAHLLSDQMADMYFDRELQLWTKRRGPTAGATCEDHPADEATDDDLFGDIPDLSVNEMEELRRVKEAVSSACNLTSDGYQSPKGRSVMQQPSPQAAQPHQTTKNEERPCTPDAQSIPAASDRSTSPRLAHSGYSGYLPNIEVNACIEDSRLAQHESEVNPPISPLRRGKAQSHGEDVDHEFSMLEGRVSSSPAPVSNFYRQPRVVTVAFSSPLIKSPRTQEKDCDNDSESFHDDTPSKSKSAPQHPSSTGKPSLSKFPRQTVQRILSRRQSLRDFTQIPRPMSRLDEQDEMSLVHFVAQHSNDALRTPQSTSRCVFIPESHGRSSIGFRLSPLDDFTLDQVDEPLDSEPQLIVKRSRGGHPQLTGDVLSQTAQALVRNLTDMEPFEPYWEDLRSLNLSDRGLTSLHMLDKFCNRVTDLDVSDNQIGELDGLPCSIRTLCLRGNCLTDLTAWHSLAHLQYLDVSGNGLRSLKGFCTLVHLRGLKADNNGIDSLDGIEELDGLLSLSLRNNRVDRLDFTENQLGRLTDLDLRCNQLTKITCLHNLSALKTCHLGGNRLARLDFSGYVRALEHLDISDNEIATLNIDRLPRLRRLIVDRNPCSFIEGVQTHRHLEDLSWRELMAPSHAKIEYQDCHDIRDLSLSGTLISHFAPNIPFLNLNTLELASAGLRSLPPDFGAKCNNLRTLNLNYNAIQDVRPLLGIGRLRVLCLVGNRLSRLRRTAAVLNRLASVLEDIDLRHNPLTVGYYTPQFHTTEEKRLVVHDERNVTWRADEEDTETLRAKAYQTPPLDTVADDLARDRLDEDTRLRRRVHEMLIVNACPRLERLDGLNVDRRRIGKKDGIWDRLLELGILKGKVMGS